MSFIVIIVGGIFFNHICKVRGCTISWNNGTIKQPALGKTAHSKLVMLVLRTENSYALSYMCSDPKAQSTTSLMAVCLLLFCFMLIRPTSLTFVEAFFSIVTVSRLFERYPFVIRSDVTFVIFLRQKCVPRQSTQWIPTFC